jgi:hypothetical protein
MGLKKICKKIFLHHLHENENVNVIMVIWRLELSSELLKHYSYSRKNNPLVFNVPCVRITSRNCEELRVLETMDSLGSSWSQKNMYI